MNSLLQLWRRFRCQHNFKYAMRISSQGEQFRVYECPKCFDVKYKKIEGEEDEEEFKDLGRP